MRISLLFIAFFISLICCSNETQTLSAQDSISVEAILDEQELRPKQKQIVEAALSIVDPSIVYDPNYYSIAYPNGDVPANIGVCTDVVIRTYRKLGVDLQKEVHEDMKANFSIYPKTWGLKKPDPNIDHRRVPNLMVYFGRFGNEKPITRNPKDYEPGDIICWRLSNGMTHIGVMVNQKSADGQRYLIVHNIGRGQIVEDILFGAEIIGHYSYENW